MANVETQFFNHPGQVNEAVSQLNVPLCYKHLVLAHLKRSWYIILRAVQRVNPTVDPEINEINLNYYQILIDSFLDEINTIKSELAEHNASQQPGLSLSS